MQTNEDVLFGKIALKHRLIDAERLRACAGQTNGKSLGEVLVAKGYITAKKHREILAEVRSGSLPRPGGSTGLPPSGAGVHAAEIATQDFSHLVGEPLDRYLVEARRMWASDLHIRTGARPYVRLHGEMIYLQHPVLRAEDTEPAILGLLSDEDRWSFERHNECECCYEAEHGRYRASVLRQRRGVDAVFRVVPHEVPTLAQLHLPETLYKFTEYRQGLVLITGAAGSGRTSTAVALVDVINRSRCDHIVTVEEPIEYVLESQNCNVNQRCVGKHTESHATALRSAMRSDPDYIFIGEMRDLETMRIAITAAETGHLVFATLHTTGAVRSINRIIDVFPVREQEQIRTMVAESLRGVITQQLLLRADGRGREPAVEIMFATPAVAKLIRERKTHQLVSVLQTGMRDGMLSMDDSIGQLLAKGLISRETALKHAESRERFTP